MDNSANFQINVNGNAYVAVQNLFAEFTKIVQVVGQVDTTVKDSTNQIAEHIDKTTGAFGRLKSKIDTISMVSMLEYVEKVSTAIASISAPGIGFEQSMADLSSITGIVGDDLAGLSETARETGKQSGLGAKQAADAFALLASQIQVDKIGMEGLKVLQQNTITLSHAAGMSMSDAATALAGTINQFGLQASEANRVINVLAAGSKYGAAEIVDLSQSFKMVGSAAAVAGLSVESTAGAVEVLSKNNLKGSEAGVALRNIILKMQTVLGADFKKVGLSDALDQLKPKLNDAVYLSKVFGMENIAAAQFLIKNSEAVNEMTQQVTGTNVAQEQAAIRTETTQQMMARCQATIDDLKIGFFELTGSMGGYMTILAQQAVTIAQLLPLIMLLGKGLSFVTSAQKLSAAWTGIATAATSGWAVVQSVLNASLWACPITWIVAGIAALIAIVVLCVTKVQGWGKQWDSIVKFMTLTGKLFVTTIKYEFTTMANGIMIGLDYIKMGWYKFKEAIGLGDSDKNQQMIAKIGGDIESRKQEIIDGAKQLRDLGKQAGKSLTWELSLKKGEQTDKAAAAATNPLANIVPDATAGGAGDGGFNLNLGGKGKGGNSSAVIKLDNIIPDIKGSTAYAAIASRLSMLRMPSVAAAAASLAMPITTAATVLPMGAQQQPASTEIMATRQDKPRLSLTKFCDKIEIHIAKADGKGADEIRDQVEAVLKEFVDDYA